MLFSFFLFLFWFFWDLLSLCILGCPGTHYVTRLASHSQRFPPPSWLLELKACITIPSLCMLFLCLVIIHVLIAWLSARVNQTFVTVTKHLSENWKGRKLAFGSVFQPGQAWWTWASHTIGGQGAERDAWSHGLPTCRVCCLCLVPLCPSLETRESY